MKVTLPLTALRNYGAVPVPDEMVNGEIPTGGEGIGPFVLFVSAVLQFKRSNNPAIALLGAVSIKESGGSDASPHIHANYYLGRHLEF